MAILSDEDFDAKQVDKLSLTFGRTGDEASFLFCYHNNRFDHNGDGLTDLKCQFKISLTEFQLGDTEGILKGRTQEGVPIIGIDSVVIVK